MEIEKKSKVKKVCLITYLVVSTILSLILIICCCVAIPNIKKSDGLALRDNEVSYNINRENKKLVSYDDENYVITLTANELNNYTWDNFNDYVCANFSSLFSVSNAIDEVQYNGNSYNFESDIYLNDANNVYIDYNYSNNLIEFNYDDGSEPLNQFHYYSPNETDYLPFEYNVSFICYAEYYDDLKSAIELDIQANDSQGNINDSIFGTLTTSVVAFIGSLSSGIVAMTSIFYTNNALTVIGLLSVIVVAVALAYWLFRLIIGLIRMRG